jgi:Cu/Ag efflux protein CusF
MRKYLYTAAVAALALAFVAPAKAAEEVKAKKATVKAHEITGVIDKIDGMSVTVKKGDETKVVVCDEKTKISTADKKDGATLADLKVGDKVKAAFIEQDGKNVCKKIGPPPAPKPKKEAK